MATVIAFEELSKLVEYALTLNTQEETTLQYYYYKLPNTFGSTGLDTDVQTIAQGEVVNKCNVLIFKTDSMDAILAENSEYIIYSSEVGIDVDSSTTLSYIWRQVDTNEINLSEAVAALFKFSQENSKE